MGHRIRVVCGVEVQPGLLGILFQQPLAFQAAAYTLTDALNQAFQLITYRCPATLKAGRSVEVVQ